MRCFFWRIRLPFWRTVSISLCFDRQNREVPLGGPVPPASLSLFCVCGTFQPSLTFPSWSQRLLLCLTAFFIKMNFIAYFILFIFTEQIPSQTQISFSLILQWQTMYVHSSMSRPAPWGTYYFPLWAPRWWPSLFLATICCSYQVDKGKDAAARTNRKLWAFLSPFSCSRPPQLPLIRDSSVLHRL